MPIYRIAVNEANYFNSGMVVDEVKVFELGCPTIDLASFIRFGQIQNLASPTASSLNGYAYIYVLLHTVQVKT